MVCSSTGASREAEQEAMKVLRSFVCENVNALVKHKHCPESMLTSQIQSTPGSVDSAAVVVYLSSTLCVQTVSLAPSALISTTVSGQESGLWHS